MHVFFQKAAPREPNCGTMTADPNSVPPSSSSLPVATTLHNNSPQLNGTTYFSSNSFNSRKTVQFTFRNVSASKLKAALVSIHAKQRLALMLALQWRSQTFWSLTGFGAGLVVVRLIFPHLRLFCVLQRLGLARIVAGTPATTRTLVIAEETTPPKTPQRKILYFDVDHDDRGELSSVEEVEHYEDDYDGDLNASDEEERDIMSDESPVLPRRLSSRRNIVDPITVQTMMDSAEPTSPIRSIPVERIGDSPTHPQSSVYYSSISGNASPVRAGSRQSTKRISVHFPIQPPSTHSSRPPSWHASPVLGPDILKTPTEGSFLTILAAQERRVLELKEELRRAEDDLTRMKNQWATHEMYKKQQQTRRVLPLQPLRTNLSLLDGSDDELDESQQALQREMDRRKVLLGGVRSSGRKVFSGSRHTRALSLLSPDKGNTPIPFTMESTGKKLSPPYNPRSALERSSTTPDMLIHPTNNKGGDIFNEIAGVPKDALFTAGKQMMGDMKDTFWTFVGDIRQVTVGSEGANGPTNHQPRPLGRSKSQRSSTSHDKRLARRSIGNGLITSQPRGHQAQMSYNSTAKDISSSFWRDHGILESPQAGLRRSAEASKRSKTKNNNTSPLSTPSKSLTPSNFEDSWDVWGTPTPVRVKPSMAPSLTTRTESHSGSNNSSVDLKSVGTSSVEGSVGSPQSSMATSDGWPPMLAKIAPDGIKSTALGLMADWERAIGGEDKENENNLTKLE
jgi:Domain of unknown function (DUF4048)